MKADGGLRRLPTVSDPGVIRQLLAHKERPGLREEEKIRPGTFEPMWNPVSQDEPLNEAGCELNVGLGLCGGHDSLCCRHSKGLATTRVARDGVLAHNPVGALRLTDSCFRRVWGPLGPATPPRLQAENRESPSAIALS